MTQLTHSITAYQTIRQRILALEADIDDTTLADTVEGLTDLNEVVAAVVRSALIDEAMVDGLKGHILDPAGAAAADLRARQRAPADCPRCHGRG